MDNLKFFISNYGYIYLILISAVSIIVTVADKILAICHSRRVPEKTLLFVSCVGGSFAMLATMLIIRHKTRHPKFMIGIPFIMLIQATLAAFFFFFSK